MSHSILSLRISNLLPVQVPPSITSAVTPELAPPLTIITGAGQADSITICTVRCPSKGQHKDIFISIVAFAFDQVPRGLFSSCWLRYPLRPHYPSRITATESPGITEIVEHPTISALSVTAKHPVTLEPSATAEYLADLEYPTTLDSLRPKSAPRSWFWF